MSGTHTPGPWNYRPEKLHDDVHHVAGRGPEVAVGLRFTIHVPANGPTRDEEAEATARLIAAAPEMLEALRAFADEAERESAFPSEVAAARAAIAKAEGGAS